MSLEEQINQIVITAVERSVKAHAHAADEPMLLTIKAATTRTGIARDRLIQAFHAGEIDGMWSAGRGRGQILLKPASVHAWVDAQIADQSAAREAALAVSKRRVS